MQKLRETPASSALFFQVLYCHLDRAHPLKMYFLLQIRAALHCIFARGNFVGTPLSTKGGASTLKNRKSRCSQQSVYRREERALPPHPPGDTLLHQTCFLQQQVFRGNGHW